MAEKWFRRILICPFFEAQNYPMKKLYSSNFLLIFSLISFCFLALLQGRAQDNKNSVGIAAGPVVSANGYGVRYSTMVFLKHNRSTLGVGAILGNYQAEVSGLQMWYDYALTGCSTPNWKKDSKEYPCNKNMELFTFISVAYNPKGYLCQKALMMEKESKDALACDVKSYVFKSAEAYAGFGLKVRFLKNFKWSNAVGLGGYYTFNHPGHIFYDKYAVGLFLKTELIFRLKL